MNKKWKPKFEDMYWCVDFYEEEGVCDNVWFNDTCDNNLYNNGVVYKTKEEAEEAYQRVLKALKNE